MLIRRFNALISCETTKNKNAVKKGTYKDTHKVYRCVGFFRSPAHHERRKDGENRQLDTPLYRTQTAEGVTGG